MSLSAIATRGFLVGERAQPFDEAVQLWRLVRGHDAASHAEQGDAVGEVVLQAEQDHGDCEDQDERHAERGQGHHEHDVDQAQQEHREEHPGRELDVPREAAPACHQPGIRPSSDSSARTSSIVASGPGSTRSDGPR
jgi:hypothetical protein